MDANCHASDDTLMIRASLASCGTSFDVRTKCPRWFVWNVRSYPSFVSSRDCRAITPALFIKTSTGFLSRAFSNAEGNALMLSKSHRSSGRANTLLLIIPRSDRYCCTSWTAFSPLAAVRVVNTTSAPATAKRFPLSSPRPYRHVQ